MCERRQCAAGKDLQRIRAAFEVERAKDLVLRSLVVHTSKAAPERPSVFVVLTTPLGETRPIPLQRISGPRLMVQHPDLALHDCTRASLLS